MTIASVCGLLLAAISLDGVVGSDLVVQSNLDARNVRIGDPIELTVDFFGSADFGAIHPPALAKAVDAKVWKVDDASAKTETYRNARRLVYMLRPRQLGVVEFPALDFTYTNADTGNPVTVSSTPIPVHVRPGSQVALAELDEMRTDMPLPDGIVIDLGMSPWGSSASITEDELFAWRKACSDPSPAAFAKFDFPEARLNEAACELLEGNWARALKIYRRLEWSIGQTPAIERGIVSAIALKTGNAQVELPVWRQVMRPVLRHAFIGRISIVLGVLLAFVVLVFVVRRGVRALAALAVVCCVFASSAAQPARNQVPSMFGGFDPFAEMERMHQQMNEQMNQMLGTGALAPGGIFTSGGLFGNGGMTMTINGQAAPEVKITASVRPDRTGLKVGEPFKLILALESPKDCTISNIQFAPSQTVGYSIVGNGEQLTDGRTDNPSNIVRRIAIPVRYDAPFAAKVTCDIAGMYTCRIVQDAGHGRSFTSSFSSNFRAQTPPIWMEVKPLSDKNRPDDFTGAVGSAFRLEQRADLTRVATNDVVALVCTLSYDGFVPPDAIPGGVAEENGKVVYRRYFVADGSSRTPDESFSYYDVKAKDYRRATAKGVRLQYVSEDEDVPKTVVVNAGDAARENGLLRLRFAPREGAREIGTADPTSSLTVTERRGAWSRVDDGRHAGWVKSEELRK